MGLKDIGDILGKALYTPKKRNQDSSSQDSTQSAQPEPTSTGKSTIDTIKERNARTQYEIEKQTGAPVPDTFEEWYSHRSHGI